MTINGVLEEVCEAVGLEQRAVHLPVSFGHDLGAFLAEVDAVSYTNAEHRHLADLDRHGLDFRAIHVIRDPRDVVVSAYFSHRNTHPLAGWPELGELRPRLVELPREEGLLAEIDFLHELRTDGHPCRPVQSMVEWPSGDPRVLELRFEDLAADEVGFFTRAARHLGLVDDDGAAGTVTPGTLERLVAEHSFTRTGRQPGEENRAAHNRRGVAGEWRRHFTERVADRFREVFPGAVPALGYAPDDDWFGGDDRG